MSLTTALCYVRVSSEDQAREGLSLATQLAECQRYAVHHGWLLGDTYQDILSGTRDDRVAYQRLLADVRQLRARGMSVVIVVAALDRFGRRLLERVRSRDELKALGVAVHSVREGGEVSDLVANILGSVAQEEVRRLGERVKANRAFLRERGWHTPGDVPWGYRWRPATQVERGLGAPISVLDIDHDQAPYVRELFRMVAGGMSARAAAAWVKSLPVDVRGGRVMSRQGVLHVLRTGTYVAKPPARWPALVDEITWERVQAFLADHVRHAHQASGRYLLTGFLVCPWCGGKVYGWMKSLGRYYRCAPDQTGGTLGCSNWTARADALERAVLAEIATVLEPFVRADLPALRRALRQVEQPGELASYRASRLAKFRKDAQDAREALIKAGLKLVHDELDRPVYELIRADQQARLDAAEAEIARLGETPRRPATLDPEAMELLIFSLPAVLEHGDIPHQRRVLAELVTEVKPTRIGRGRYRIELVWTLAGEQLRKVGAGLSVVRE